MKDIQKNFLHDITAELLNLPPNKVLWAYQNKMPRTLPPYAVIRLWGMKSEGQEEIRETEIDDVKNIFVPQTTIFEVQYFAGTTTKIDPSHELEKFVRRLENPLVVDRFFQKNIAVYQTEEVQDLTTLINGQIYEYRATVDLRVRYNSELKENLGAIEEVRINFSEKDSSETIPSGDDGEEISKVENKNVLIYGKIKKDGTVTDLERAVPLSFEIRGEK